MYVFHVLLQFKVIVLQEMNALLTQFLEILVLKEKKDEGRGVEEEGEAEGEVS